MSERTEEIESHPVSFSLSPFTAYLDFVCPFSKRLFERVFNEVLPAAEKAHPGKLRFIFRHQIQPWHPQSAIVHEASVAVAQVDPSKFLAYAAILFAKQTQWVLLRSEAWFSGR